MKNSPLVVERLLSCLPDASLASTKRTKVFGSFGRNSVEQLEDNAADTDASNRDIEKAPRGL